MKTYHIHINGIVQGVGFRPTIYQLAKEMRLNGYVKNGSDGVHVYINAAENTAALFFQKVKQLAPANARIISAELREVPGKIYDNFLIIVENDHELKDVLIPPDRAICDSCRRELHDATNRRYRYPFITCTHCGPRYSIINKIPYERQDTSMQYFDMCEKCSMEYSDVFDRRFFSQTNSCAGCGMELFLLDNNSFLLSNDSRNILSQVFKFISQGKIIAVKGVTGYLILCDAGNDAVIKQLRLRKNRPGKPLALLYPSIDNVEKDFKLSEKEKKLLQSTEAPIVLLYPENETLGGLAMKDIAPGLKRAGVMLPYTPLLDIIATDYGKPLIATSANISGSPVFYQDDDANDHLGNIADYIVSHSNKIIIPQDDSVVQVSQETGQKIMLRRSRGFAPSFLQYKPNSDRCLLATGAFLKSSFTMTINGNTFVSQYLGSGESYESQQLYKNTLNRWLNLYSTDPQLIITDSHPGYFSHQYALELGERYQVDVKRVQHHEAHFAAVLAENHLLQSTAPVMGVIWDGTGLGRDGNTWGGEFFKFENNQMLRCYHFDYFPAIAGDKLALEPRIAALCAINNAWPQPGNIKEKFTNTEWANYQSLIDQTERFTSSVGRIFDAVASLLDICDKQSYEGEAANYLQVLAEDYVFKNGFVMDDSYFKEGSHYYRIPTASLIQGILVDIKKGKAKNYIAAKFHYSFVCLIDIVAKYINAEKICFSGGVFQNALLADWIQTIYKNKYELYFHRELSPNDENISFGQMVYHDHNIKTISKEYLPEQQQQLI